MTVFRPALAGFFVALMMLDPIDARDDGRHAGSPLRTWFSSLMRPDTGTSCCDESDCRRTEMEMTARGYRAALPDGTWVDIPNEIVIHNKGNPTGEPVLCALPSAAGWRLYCFVPAGGV